MSGKLLYKDSRLKITAKQISATEADLHIYGEIGYDNTSYSGGGTNNQALEMVRYIKSYADKYTRVNLHLNSPGGIVDDGLAIYNAIKSSKGEIHTYNDGVVASMATIIFLAGHVRHLAKASIVMVHQPSTITIGNTAEHLAQIANLQVYEDTLTQIIADRTGMEVKEVQKKFMDGKDHFLTSDDAMSMNFADVIEDSEAKPLKASSKDSIFKGIRQTISNIFSEKIVTINQPIKMKKPIKTYANLQKVINLGVTISEGEDGSLSTSEQDLEKIAKALEEEEKAKKDAEAREAEAKKELETSKTEVEALKAKNADLQKIIDSTKGTSGFNGAQGEGDAKDKFDLSDISYYKKL